MTPLLLLAALLASAHVRETICHTLAFPGCDDARGDEAANRQVGDAGRELEMPGITILEPAHDIDIDEDRTEIEVSFRTDYPDLNHYIQVTPEQTPNQHHLMYGPIGLDRMRNGRGTATLGGIEAGKGGSFFVSIIATKERVDQSVPAANEIVQYQSNIVQATRRKKMSQ